jgi:hypothetical protein
MLHAMQVSAILVLVLLNAAPHCNSFQHFKPSALKLIPGRMTVAQQSQGLGQSTLTFRNSHSQNNMFERSKTTLYSTIEPAADPNALTARTTARKTGNNSEQQKLRTTLCLPTLRVASSDGCLVSSEDCLVSSEVGLLSQL